jgi:hypothetical protein
MNRFIKQRHTIWLGIAVFSVLFFFSYLSPSVKANTVGEEFLAPENYAKGSVVSLNQDNPKEVILGNLTNDDYLLGVINSSDENSVTYSKELSNVTVSLSGEVQVFVTDAAGEIKKGDFVGASWIEGVAMKSDSKDIQRLLGVALGDADFSTANEYGPIDTTDGQRDARIGSLRIRLFNKDSLAERSDEQSVLTGFLQDLSGKEVSVAKAFVVTFIFVGSLALAGFFVGSSLRGSFISIGRNPRASTIIFRDLTHVTSVSLIMILMGTALSYVVLAL